MSYRNDTNVPYDLSILSGIPDPTWAEKQVDRRSYPPPAPGHLPMRQQSGLLENVAEPAVPKVPWYRTRWGITAIVTVTVLLIGGIVGGAVGGTHHSSNSPRQSSSSNQGGFPITITSISTSTGGGGLPDPTSSTIVFQSGVDISASYFPPAAPAAMKSAAPPAAPTPNHTPQRFP
ncbi:hypothetical protein BGY98DRAFT_934167 [Russula aff. rugulosa BPL654]|nr:hypothetical protein BGY98DRAFT_934167 [Russula aff. rugulosa BPL654]